MFSGARAAGTRRSAAHKGLDGSPSPCRRDDSFVPRKKEQGPQPRQSDGPNISVTSENGVTEFTFTLTLA